jgi:hypothetical protein
MNALKQAGARLIALWQRRDARRLARFDGFLYDLRLTLRGLRRDWAFTPRWTSENRQFVDRAKPAIYSGGRDQ